MRLNSGVPMMARSRTGTVSDYRSLRRQLLALTAGGALLLVLGMQIAGQLLNQMLVEDAYGELQQQLSSSYRHEIDSTLRLMTARLNNLLKYPQILQHVRNRDRAALLAEMAWRYRSLQDENPYLEVLHFHGPDNRTLLRLHQPQHFGDDLSAVRPMIVDANRNWQLRKGFEIGKNGISYRVALPISDGGVHLGVLEMGINIRYFTEQISRIFFVQVVPLFHARAMQAYLEEHGEAGLQRIGDDFFAFRGLSAELLTAAQHGAASAGNIAFFDQQGERRVVYKVFGIENYRGEDVGNLVALSPASRSLEQVWQYVLWSSLSILLLLGGLLFGQYRVFSRMQTAITHLAFYDALTGLPNRSLFLDRLQQALHHSQRSGQFMAVLFIDLDNFKTLNDTRGHHVGDELLQQTATRLLGCIRSSDTVARQGGDEFVLVLHGLGSDRHAAARQVMIVGEKIQAALNQPYHLENGLVHQGSSSIGICLNTGTGLTSDDLLKRADIAMYQAKSAGRNRVCIYSEPA